jgi:hypothetical protein
MEFIFYIFYCCFYKKTSKFSLYFSCSCIPVNPRLSYIFSPEFLVVFNRFQCKKYQIFDDKFQILCLYFAACQACVEFALEIQRTICRQPITGLNQFDFSRAMPTLNLRTGMLRKRDCFRYGRAPSPQAFTGATAKFKMAPS